MQRGHLFIAVLLISLGGCKENPGEGSIVPPIKIKEEANPPLSSPTLELEILESFSDSTRIGHPGENKVEVIKRLVKDEARVEIKFFSRRGDDWKERNHFEFEGYYIGIDPTLVDLNNDQFLDFHYKACLAARGANDVRRMFIYDPRGDSLVHLVNSLEYPNPEYNAHLDCIDAWMIHGCSSQAFLRVKADSLIPFAWVYNDESSVRVYEVYRDGTEHLTIEDSAEIYSCLNRYLNYDPLILYGDEN